MPSVMPAKPVTCIGMRPNRGTAQMPTMKPTSRKTSTKPLPFALAKSDATAPPPEDPKCIAPRMTGVNSPTP